MKQIKRSWNVRVSRMSRSNLFYLLSWVCDESSKNIVSLEIRVCAQTHNRDIHTTTSSRVSLFIPLSEKVLVNRNQIDWNHSAQSTANKCIVQVCECVCVCGCNHYVQHWTQAVYHLNNWSKFSHIFTSCSIQILAHKIMTALFLVLVLEFKHDQAKY